AAPRRCAGGRAQGSVFAPAKSIAAGVRRRGSRRHRVCPGTVAAPPRRERANALPDPVQARKGFIARQPMGRLGTVDDIAGWLIFLASDEALFATGNAYPIDGGMTI